MDLFCMSPTLLVLIHIALLYFMPSIGATQYDVGGSAGWGLTGVDYSDLASKNTYHVGDKLYFAYTAGLHSVLQVSEQDYQACSTSNPMASDNSVGNQVVDLTAEGKYYYICGKSGHCQQGMKLGITVSGSSSSSSIPSTPSSTSSSTAASASGAAGTQRSVMIAHGLLAGCAAAALSWLFIFTETLY